jgi:hypothetical protein
MSIAFDQIIRNGILVLPEHVKDAVEGQSVHVVIEAPSDKKAARPRSSILNLIHNPVQVPGFQPLTREEANERPR